MLNLLMFLLLWIKIKIKIIIKNKKNLWFTHQELGYYFNRTVQNCLWYLCLWYLSSQASRVTLVMNGIHYLLWFLLLLVCFFLSEFLFWNLEAQKIFASRDTQEVITIHNSSEPDLKSMRKLTYHCVFIFHGRWC